jgi:hypothetical protein
MTTMITPTHHNPDDSRGADAWQPSHQNPYNRCPICSALVYRPGPCEPCRQRALDDDSAITRLDAAGTWHPHPHAAILREGPNISHRPMSRRACAILLWGIAAAFFVLVMAAHLYWGVK